MYSHGFRVNIPVGAVFYGLCFGRFRIQCIFPTYILKSFYQITGGIFYGSHQNICRSAKPTLLGTKELKLSAIGNKIPSVKE
jgi:hypothetical protein